MAQHLIRDLQDFERIENCITVSGCFQSAY
jgi:hypothetical protein